jgi:predicted TIM-barrel fold metal-dependent hydrolase
MWIDEAIADYRQQRAALDWFDANCWIGVGPRGLLRPVATVDETLRLLRRYGIERAVVAHAAARDYDPEAGNRWLCAAIAAHDCLRGAAVIAPGGRTLAALQQELAGLVAKNVRLVRVFPRSHNVRLDGPWLEVLTEFGLPLAVWHTETTWDDVAAVCQAHPRLNLIVEGPHRKLFYHNRIYYGLLERFANFHLEIHNLVNYLGVDDLVRRFGSERLIFGSFLPEQDPNVAMSLVTLGAMSQADRQNIAGRNLQRLVEGVSQR